MHVAQALELNFIIIVKTDRLVKSNRRNDAGL